MLEQVDRGGNVLSILSATCYPSVLCILHSFVNPNRSSDSTMPQHVSLCSEFTGSLFVHIIDRFKLAFRITRQHVLETDETSISRSPDLKLL